jgi:hypothetical protein
MKKALTIFVLALITNAGLFAQIIYTNPSPDITVSNNAIYLLDVNNDGIDDFKFLHEDSASGLNGNGLGIAIMHLDAEFLGGMPPQDPTHYYPYKLESNTFIDILANGNEWVVKHPDPDAVRVLNLQFNNNTYAGLWVFGVIDRYLGIRIRLNGNWHYGWIRLDVNASATSMLIKDWAYEATPNMGIYAGDSITVAMAEAALNVTMQDVGNSHSAADIQIDFSKALDESGILEYRVSIVKEVNASSFDMAIAEVLPPDRYHAIVPNGMDQTAVMPSSLLDADGDPIQENVAYQAFVFSLADGSQAILNNLSQPSPATTLLNTIGMETLDLFPVQITHHDDVLRISTGLDQEYQVLIYSINGNVVLSSKFHEGISLSTKSLASSIYVVHFIGKDYSISEKIYLP